MLGLVYKHQHRVGIPQNTPKTESFTSYQFVQKILIINFISAMAFRNSIFLALFFAVFAILSNINGGLAARQLLQTTTPPNLPKLPPFPSIPNMPKPTALPPLPSIPTTLPQPTLPTTQPSLPKPTLPPLPSLPTMPTLPKLSLPPLPATLPNFPSMPTIPSIPFLSPPPSKTSP